MYRVEWAHGVTGLESLKTQWNDLLGACLDQSFNNCFDWHYALNRYLLQSGVSYACVRKGDQLIAVFPFMQEDVRRFGMKWKTLKYFDHSHLPLFDILYDHRENTLHIYESVIEFLQKQTEISWHKIVFARFRERSNLNNLAKEINLSRKKLKESLYTPVNSEPNWDKVLSKKRLKTVRYEARSAEKTYTSLSFECCSDPDLLEDAFQRFMQMEASGWKGSEGEATSINMDENYKAFYRSLMTAETPNFVSINFLYFGDIAVASQFCVRKSNCWNLVKIAYNEEYRKFGPGNALILKLIEHLVADGAPAEINVVTGPEWARKWHFIEETTYAAEIFNHSLKGRLIKMLQNLKR